MSFAVYNADCWCEECAADIKKKIVTGWLTGFIEQIYHEMKSPLAGISGKSVKLEISGKASGLVEDLRDRIIEYMDEQTLDTDDWPSCGIPEESVDCPSHCGAHEECLEAEVLDDGSKIGALLGTSLTPDGVEYVKEQLLEGALRKEGPSLVEKFWAEQFSDYDLRQPLRVRVTDIDYDLSSGSEDDEEGTPPELPKELIVEVEANAIDNDDVSSEAIDAVSDETGWCVNAATCQILNPAAKE